MERLAVNQEDEGSTPSSGVMKKLRYHLNLRWLRIKWFVKQAWVLWRWKNRLGLDGNWPTVLLKPHSKGEQVRDDLTGDVTTVLGVEYAEGHTNPGQSNNPDQMGCWGIYVDSDHFSGARHPWEVTPIN